MHESSPHDEYLCFTIFFLPILIRINRIISETKNNKIPAIENNVFKLMLLSML